MFTFPLFNSFPIEIHSLILEACPTNDAVCLRLTCRYLYDLAPSKKPVALDNSDIEPCNVRISINDDSALRASHRQECHKRAYEKACKLAEARGRSVHPIAYCQSNYWMYHCTCFEKNTQLHCRVKKWGTMPKSLYYCNTCRKFTRRRRDCNGHRERCTHGYRRWRLQPRPQRFWTHHARRGAFGHKLWKKWFNNKAMNNYESRLRTQTERSGTERYSLRKLKLSDVDTRSSRIVGWQPDDPMDEDMDE